MNNDNKKDKIENLEISKQKSQLEAIIGEDAYKLIKKHERPEELASQISLNFDETDLHLNAGNIAYNFKNIETIFDKNKQKDNSLLNNKKDSNSNKNSKNKLNYELVVNTFEEKDEDDFYDLKTKKSISINNKTKQQQQKNKEKEDEKEETRKSRESSKNAENRKRSSVNKNKNNTYKNTKNKKQLKNAFYPKNFKISDDNNNINKRKKKEREKQDGFKCEICEDVSYIIIIFKCILVL